jgi:serine/threonine-protein kinase
MLQHPAFPALYGCGEEEDGTGWLLMERISGSPLAALKDAPAWEVLRVSHGIASALEALHAAGFLHRDIAFDNVLVETRRSGRNPRLIDLGVAKDLQSQEDLTMIGSFLGRSEFASPELLTSQGAAGVVDPRSDVFSFGVLLYEWLSGAPPFPGETPADVLRAQKKRTAPKLVLRESARDAPADLAPFVESLLVTELEKRPTASAVVRRLVELRSRCPRPALELALPAGSLLNVKGQGHFLLPQKFPAAPASKRLRMVSFPPIPEGEIAPAPPGSATPPASEAPLERSAEPQGPDMGRLILVGGILAFVAACAVAAWLLLGR